MYNDALDPTAPTPQDYGFPENPAQCDIQCWHHQEAFLKLYRWCGKIGISAEAIGLTRRAVEYWMSSDHFAFKKG
jgi:hypothetical protein